MLEIGGFTPLSTTDWPGQLAAVVFVQGCPWRCHYCHNVELQPRSRPTTESADASPAKAPCPSPSPPSSLAAPAAIDWPTVLRTLQRRRGLLDGVVFSGGEPTLDPALPEAMQDVRELGFKVGLHTAGIYPDRLDEVLPLTDWVGFDLKADFAAYASVTAVPRSGQPAWRSFQAVLRAARHGGLDFEVRTTYHPRLHSDEHLLSLATMLTEAGVSRWVLQNFRPAYDEHADLASDWLPPQLALLQRLRETGVELTLR